MPREDYPRIKTTTIIRQFIYGGIIYFHGLEMW